MSAPTIEELEHTLAGIPGWGSIASTIERAPGATLRPESSELARSSSGAAADPTD